MKALSTAIQTQQAAQEKRPVNLIILELDSGTLRYAAAKQSITFPAAGNTYTAKAIGYGGVQTSSEGQIGRLSVRMDNTARDMMSYANTTQFKGRMLTIWKVYHDASGSTDYEEIFRGVMEDPSFDYNWITIPATSSLPLKQKYPNRTYGKMCDLSFGGAGLCNADNKTNLAAAPLYVTGTSDRGGVTHLYDNALNQAVDFWNYGRLSCYVGGVSQERTVVDFSGGTVTFDVACSVSISSATRYSLKAGCPKTWAACSAVSPWGPTADNTVNYGGFLHVDQKGTYDEW